jgi:hypothetical protein
MSEVKDRIIKKIEFESKDAIIEIEIWKRYNGWFNIHITKNDKFLADESYPPSYELGELIRAIEANARKQNWIRR